MTKKLTIANDPLAFIGGKKNNEIIEIEINEIEINEQPRHEFDFVKIHEMAESIKQVGVLNPPVVYQKDGKYVMLDGERRCRACKVLGMNKLLCVVKDIKEEDVRAAQLIANIHRKDLTKMELYEAFKFYQDQGVSIRDIAAKVGMNKSDIQRILSAKDLSEEIKQQITDDKSFEKVVEANKIKDEFKKKEVMDNLDKLTRGEIKKIKNKSKPHKLNKNKDKNEVSEIRTLNADQDKNKNKSSDAEQKTISPEAGQTGQITPPTTGQEIGQKLKFNETEEDRLEIKELVKKFETVLSINVLFQINTSGNDEITIQAGTKTLIDIMNGLKKKFNLN